MKEGIRVENIKQVTIRELVSIIDTREPRGLFYYNPDNVYVGCDNTSGDAWTEQFRNKEKCIEWLKGRYEMSEMNEMED